MTPQPPRANGGLIGVTFGTYRIVAKLGEGGMGEVFRAHDSTLRRDVALKVLTGWSANDPANEDRLARFAREARALAALNHPHIATIYGVETRVPDDAGLATVTALVLELVEGETLADRIRRGPLPQVDAVRLAVQIAGALAAAHEKGIVHRDLKPANIKVTPAGVVKVLDFGLAKTIVDADPAAHTRTEMVTREGTVVGTPAYMSPEQVRGQEMDARTDVWALGCVLYEMLTGRLAFAGGGTDGRDAAHCVSALSGHDATRRPCGRHAGGRRGMALATGVPGPRGAADGAGRPSRSRSHRRQAAISLRSRQTIASSPMRATRAAGSTSSSDPSRMQTAAVGRYRPLAAVTRCVHVTVASSSTSTPRIG